MSALVVYWDRQQVQCVCVQDAGFNQAFKAIRVKFKPSAKDVQKCEESGVDLAQAVHKTIRAQERQAGSSQVKTGTVPSNWKSLWLPPKLCFPP